MCHLPRHAWYSSVAPMHIFPEPHHPVKKPQFAQIHYHGAKHGWPGIEYENTPDDKNDSNAGYCGKNVRDVPVVHRHRDYVTVKPDPLAKYTFRCPVIERLRGCEYLGIEPGPQEGKEDGDDCPLLEPEPTPECDNKNGKYSIAHDHAQRVGMADPCLVVQSEESCDCPLKRHTG